MASPYPCLNAVVLFYTVTRETTTGEALLVGPEQLAFFKSLARLCVDADESASLFEALFEVWKRGTLFVNGHPGVSSLEHAGQCSELLHVLVRAKTSERDPYMHDVLHVAAKLLRLLRFALLHPRRSLGTVTLRFPRSGTLLQRLTAATRFFDRTESREDKLLLTRLMGNPKGIADVCRKGVIFGFQSPTAIHMLTPYAVVNLPKSEATVADLRAMVAEETA